MPVRFGHLVAATAGAIFCVAAWAQSSTDIGRPAAVIPIDSEPAPKPVAYPPLSEPLARGVVIIQ